MGYFLYLFMRQVCVRISIFFSIDLHKSRASHNCIQDLHIYNREKRVYVCKSVCVWERERERGTLWEFVFYRDGRSRSSTLIFETNDSRAIKIRHCWYQIGTSFFFIAAHFQSYPTKKIVPLYLIHFPGAQH